MKRRHSPGYARRWTLGRQESKCGGVSAQSEQETGGAEPGMRCIREMPVCEAQSQSHHRPQSRHTGTVTDGEGSRAAEGSPLGTGVVRSTPV